MPWVKFPGNLRWQSGVTINNDRDKYVGIDDLKGLVLCYSSTHKSYCIFDAQYIYGACKIGDTLLQFKGFFNGYPMFSGGGYYVKYDINYRWVAAKNTNQFQQQFTYYTDISGTVYDGTEFYKIGNNLSTSNTLTPAGSLKNTDAVQLTLTRGYPCWKNDSESNYNPPGTYSWFDGGLGITETSTHKFGNNTWQHSQWGTYTQSVIQDSLISPEYIGNSSNPYYYGRIFKYNSIYVYGSQTATDNSSIIYDEFGHWECTDSDLTTDGTHTFNFVSGSNFAELSGNYADLSLQPFTLTYSGLTITTNEYDKSSGKYTMIVGDCAKWI